MALRLTNAAWLALLFNVATVRATLFWTYTSRMVESVSSSAYTYYDGEVTAMERTYTRTVSSTVTPAATVTPFSTSTYERTYADIEIVYAYYTTGAFAESDLEPDYYTMTDETTTTGPSTSTRYYMNYTLTAPSSCSTSFEFTTSTYVYIPSEVTPLITPVSTIAASPSTGYYDVYYEATWYLSNSAAPYSSESDYYWTSYVSRCTAPAAAYTGGTRSGGGDSDSDRGYTYCSIYGGCTSWKVWVIVIATIIPALFLLGLLESWFWFRRLMLGKKALRFGTICWVLISLWVLCFTRVQNARSFEDQKLLREKWRAMKAGQKFSLWFKWGFRHSYPVEHLGQYSPNTVGIVPAGQPLHTQMAQAPPGFQPGPGYPPGAPPPGFVPQGAPMPPPGQVYYPPPQGWAPAQPGQFPTPPQGYAYAPPPGTTGYYEQTKDGSMVSTSPIPVPPPQPSVSPPAPYGVSPPPPPASASEAPVSPQSPQPIHPPQLVQTQPVEVPANAPQVPAPAAQPPHGPS